MIPTSYDKRSGVATNVCLCVRELVLLLWWWGPRATALVVHAGTVHIPLLPPCRVFNASSTLFTPSPSISFFPFLGSGNSSSSYRYGKNDSISSLSSKTTSSSEASTTPAHSALVVSMGRTVSLTMPIKSSTLSIECGVVGRFRCQEL